MKSPRKTGADRPDPPHDRAPENPRTDHDFNRRAFGSDHEEIALEYLLQKGYRLKKQNFRFGKAGEIDLIMMDGPIWVFIEVKTRRSHKYGTPEESVDHRKRKQIRKIARGFLHVFNITHYTARFDVVAIDYVTGTDGNPEIRHLEDAFR